MGLLVLQSMSSFVLDSYQELLRNHLVVTLFLTMLVGAGGNAGNQSAIKVIRGLVSPAQDLKLNSQHSKATQFGTCIHVKTLPQNHLVVFTASHTVCEC